MICRAHFSIELMHTGAGAPLKVRPTTHCAHNRSDALYKLLILNDKAPCLFFDHSNNYVNSPCLRDLAAPPSTDLSTVIVDNCLPGLSEQRFWPRRKTLTTD